MARMWTCGFELQSSSAEFGVNSGAIVTGSPSISTTVHRAGTASLRANPTAATAFIEHQITSGVVMRTLHRLYLRVDTLPSTATNIYGIGQAGYFPALLRLQTDGTLVLRDGFIESTLTGTSGPLTLGRWYRVELDYADVSGTLTAGVAPFKGYLDGVQFADALCSNISGFSRVRLGVQLAASADLYIDDVAINDTTGSAQNDLPGAGNVVHLRPNAQGDNNGWATAVGGTSGAANNWTRVSERPPDDATSYNETSATGTTAIDDFNVDDAAIAGIGASDTITLVQVGGRVASNATSAASIVYRVKGQAGGTVQESASVTVANTSWSVHAGQSPRPYMLTAYTNPQTSSAWTPSSLDALQIGYRCDVSQSTVRRVSAVWALVEYVPASSTPLSLGTESAAARPLARAKRQSSAAGSETGTALPLARRKILTLAPAVEVTAASAPGRARTRPLTQAVEADAAQQPTGRAKTAPLPQAAAAVAARPLTGTRLGVLASAQETEGARPATGAKTGSLSVAAAQEQARPTGTRKRQPLGRTAETAASRSTAASKATALATVTEAAAARPLTPAAGLSGADETSAARALGQTKTAVQDTAGEVGTVRPLGRTKVAGLGVVAETATARPLTGGRSRALARSEETCSARLLGTARAQHLPTAASTDTALPIEPVSAGALAPAAEAATARTATGRKAQAAAEAAVVEAALRVTGRKASVLTAAGEASTSRSLASATQAALGPAGETAAAPQLTSRKTSALVGIRVEDQALPLVGESAGQLGRAAASEQARGLGERKARPLVAARAVLSARPLAIGKARTLGAANETAHALIGPYVRLTPAIEYDIAQSLAGRRQRPADRLAASTSASRLSPSASGPTLTATSTTGG